MLLCGLAAFRLTQLGLMGSFRYFFGLFFVLFFVVVDVVYFYLFLGFLCSLFFLVSALCLF